MRVIVDNGPGGLERAIKLLKKKVAKDRSMADLKRIRGFPKPSEKKKAKEAQALKIRKRREAKAARNLNVWNPPWVG